MMPRPVPGRNTMRLEPANVPAEQAAAMVRSQLGLPPPESS